MTSKRNSFFSGIRFQLTIAFITLAIVPLILITIVLSYTGYQHEKSQSLAFQKEKARRIAVQVNGFFDKAIDRLINVSKIRGFEGLSTKEIDSILSELVHYESYFEEVSLINSQGEETNRQHRIRLVQKTDLRNRKDEQIFAIPKDYGRVYFGPIFFDKLTGDPLLEISVPNTDVRDGNLNYIFMGSVRFRKIWDLIVSASTSLSEEVYILNSNGNVVAHKNPSVVLRKTRVEEPFINGLRTGLSGDLVMFIAEPVKVGNFTLWIVIEKSFMTAMKGAVTTVTVISLVTVVFIIIAAFLAVPAAATIVRPIQELVNSSRAIISGDFTRKVPTQGKGEIAELSSVFNNMTGQLHRLIEELKDEVEARKSMELSLQASEERYRQLAENINEAFWIVSPDWQEVFYISPAYEKIWGKSTDSLYQNPLSWLESVFSDDKAKITTYIENINEDLSEYIFPEYRIERPDGTQRWVFAKGFPIKDAGGSTIRVVGIAEDITERIHIEEQIKASLKEKETLLQEIHHRVKNNMQVINALLALQANKLEDEQIIEIFREGQNRVYAMAAVHETLHGSDSLSQIDLQTYLPKITSSVFQTYQINYDKIDLNIRIDKAPISLNQAYPLGLIINELISNAMKYAFPDDQSGEIAITVSKLDKGLELVVADNGIGLPKGLDWQQSKSLGLKLVQTLVEDQLDGSITIDTTNGTKFIINFELEPFS